KRPPTNAPVVELAALLGVAVVAQTLLVDRLCMRPTIRQKRQDFADEVAPGVRRILHAGLEEVGLLLVEIRGSRRLHTPTRSAKDLLDGIQDRPDNRVTFGHLAIDPHPLFAGEFGQPLLIHSAAPTVKSRLPHGTQEAWVDFHS